MKTSCVLGVTERRRAFPVSVRSFVLASTLVLLIPMSCSDVAMDCTTGRGNFAVQFVGPEACGLGNGDVVGAQTYQGRGTQVVQNAELPDLTEASAAIQVTRLGVLRDLTLARKSQAALQGTPYGHGKWTMPRPDANNFCSVSSMVASIANAAVPPESVDDPTTPDEDETVELTAQNKTYAFSNVRFYNTPGIQGLQFEADLTYTDALFPGAPCSTSVKAVGVYPAPNCMLRTEVTVPADPNVPGSSATTYLTGSVPDETICTDLAKGGISTDFPTHCVAATAAEYQEPIYTCTAGSPPVCTSLVPEAKVPTQGFCFLTGTSVPVLK